MPPAWGGHFSLVNSLNLLVSFLLHNTPCQDICSKLFRTSETPCNIKTFKSIGLYFMESWNKLNSPYNVLLILILSKRVLWQTKKYFYIQLVRINLTEYSDNFERWLREDEAKVIKSDRLHLAWITQVITMSNKGDVVMKKKNNTCCFWNMWKIYLFS